MTTTIDGPDRYGNARLIWRGLPIHGGDLPAMVAAQAGVSGLPDDLPIEQARRACWRAEEDWRAAVRRARDGKGGRWRGCTG